MVLRKQDWSTSERSQFRGRNALTSLLLGVLCLLLVVADAQGSSYSSESTAAFYIDKNQRGRQTVSLSVPKGDTLEKVTCSFSFDATAPSEDSSPQEKQETGVESLIEQITKKHKGSCIERTMDHWSYRVCLGEKVVQYAGNDQYVLGQFSGSYWDASEQRQFYNQGTPCAPPGASQQTFPPREASVHFVCGSGLTIQSVEEPKTCSYKVVITLPEVCGHSMFRKAVPGTGSEQSWVLQLNQIHLATENNQYRQQVQCTAYQVNYGADSQTIPLKHFALKFDSTDATIDSYQVRHPNRTPFTEDELTLGSNGVASSKDSKTNLIQYAAINLAP